MSEGASPTRLSRRSVLNFLLGASVLGWLASVLYPIIRYLTPLPLPGPTGPVRLTRAEVSKIESDKFAIVPLGRNRVLVLEDSDGELHALDAKCTHEGCTVRYVARDDLIWCACHNARFDLDGRVLAGPPPRPLSKHTVLRDDDGGIKVSVATA
jgi:cytochrome b6-f complex iron-sulfur subunit